MTIQIASRLGRVKASPSSTASQIARDLKAEGRDVVSLTIGEPDFDTPEHIRLAAVEAMERGETRYTATDGTPQLKRAIQAKFANENGLEFALDEIVVSSGGKHVVFNALVASLDEGDEVIVPAPYWVSYPDITLLAGGTPVIVKCPAAAGFKLTPDALAGAITPRTRWLILNSPSNPSGATYTSAELHGLGAVLMRHPQVAVLSDDIYEHILFDGRAHTTIAKAFPELGSRTLTLNGVSKAYAMTGWRIGFAGGPRPLMRAMSKLQSQSTSNPSSISQAAAVVALEGPQDLVRERARMFEQRRNLVVELLRAVDGLKCSVPEGAFYLYPDCTGLLGRRRRDTGSPLATDDDVVRYLLEGVGVATISGSAYGLSPHFRISIASDETVLRTACARISDACRALH